MTKENPIGQTTLTENEQVADRANQIFSTYQEYKANNSQLHFFVLPKTHYIEGLGVDKKIRGFLNDDLLVALKTDHEDQFELLLSFGEEKDEFKMTDKHGEEFLIPFKKKRVFNFESETKISKLCSNYIDLESDEDGKRIRDVNDLRKRLAKR